MPQDASDTPNAATPPPLTPHECVQVAAIATVDPRTVRNLISGRAVRSSAAGRIQAALRTLGWAYRVPFVL